MAEGGIPKLVDGLVSGLASIRGTGQAGRRTSAPTEGTVVDHGPRDRKGHGTPRQIINLDGRQFDRYAPRGTYLNLLV
jgi:hypothetical protein